MGREWTGAQWGRGQMSQGCGREAGGGQLWEQRSMYPPSRCLARPLPLSVRVRAGRSGHVQADITVKND